MSGRRWLRAASDTQWVLAVTDTTTGIAAVPTVAFTTTVTNGATLRIDATGSFSTNGPITSYVLDFGDGTVSNTPTAEHAYAIDGTYTVRVALTDSTGRSSSASRPVFIDVPTSSSNKSPTPALSVAISGLSVALDASGSTDADGTVVQYRFSFGDGTAAVTQSSPKISHTYTKDGTYSATVMVTDNAGASASTAKTFAVSTPIVTTPTDPSANYVLPWKIGSVTEGLPAGQRVVPFSTLFNRLSGSDQGSEDYFQKALNQIPSYLSSIGASGTVVVSLPDGFDYEIPGFKYGSGQNWSGIQGNTVPFVGLIGNITNGVFQARLRMRPYSMTQDQLNVVASLNVTGAGSGTGYTTNGFRGIRFQQGGGANYLMGVQFDGADMQTVTDYRETGPANWGGLQLYRPGNGSIVQNVLVRGFGKTDSTSPPGEVGMMDITRDVNSMIRRVEFDGRLPTGELRGASILWSGSDTPTVVDAYLHHSYTSGPSFSFAGSIAYGNLSRKVSTLRLRSSFNANHRGQSSGWRFPPVNHEHVQDYAVHTQGIYEMDDSTRNLWDATHMTYSWRGDLLNGDQAGQFTINDPVIVDASKGGAYSGDNGCFSIKSDPWSSQQQWLPTPIVTRNGVQLTPWVRTGAGAAPSYVTPDKYFVYKHQN